MVLRSAVIPSASSCQEQPLALIRAPQGPEESQQADRAAGRSTPSPGAASPRRQRSNAYGHRGENGQPGGRSIRLGGLPGIGVSRLRESSRAGQRREQPLGVGVVVPVEDVPARRLLHHRAGVHHDHVVGRLGDHAEVVGDEDDRGAELLLEPSHHGQHLGLHGDVEGRGRLVGDQQVGVERHRHGDHHPLPHAAGELVRVVVDAFRRVRDAHQAEQLDCAAPAPAACSWTCRGRGSSRRSANRPCRPGGGSTAGPGRSSRSGRRGSPRSWSSFAVSRSTPSKKA